MHETLLRDPLPGDIESLAATTPSTVAISAGGQSLTYRELNARANHLATRLRSLGAGPGTFVGIGLDRSLELIVAMLAVMKSGAAYVPLDPAYPRERLAHMISSAGLRLILSRTALAAIFSPPAGPPVIDVTESNGRSDDGPPATATGDDALYAIFTSGSTGPPKAASVFRKGFANLLDWYQAELGLGPGDRTLVISSPSFDLTQKNFLAPLRTGGRLILDDGDIYDISRIIGLVRDHRITLLNCTPSAFYPLIDAAAAAGFEALSSLRHVVLGGEPVAIPRLRKWLDHPACRADILNTYGPTECTDICAFHRLNRANLDDFPFVPLGREIPNVKVTIRDEDLAEVPDGLLGELCISGAGLGGGYLGDPERSAKAFALAGAFYRTGDLAVRLPCGTLEFRGRVDHQVKVNGFRIELGEIENALGCHPGVIGAVVTAKDGRLIAHVQTTMDTAALKEHLAARLPHYMVPGEFNVIDRFPLTPNGKVDRLVLANGAAAPPSPAASESTSSGRILALWSEILERPVTDPTANFFDLGGTSIHLAIVHVRLRELTGRDLAITDLFARPSAHALAGFLSPPAATAAATTAQDRARLQQAGFARFRRPAPR